MAANEDPPPLLGSQSDSDPWTPDALARVEPSVFDDELGPAQIQAVVGQVD
jgi:hypothetical protein